MGNYLEAKKMAVIDYLRHHLKYNDEEIDTIEITDTQVSAKMENLVYIVVAEEQSIRDIRSRMAEVRNPDLTMTDFIPPQYYQRYISLGKRAREMREKDTGLRTQIRFGDTDIELFTKRKGENERYTKVPMEEIEAEEQLPKFDHSIRWRRRDDRPRRYISPAKSSTITASNRLDPKTTQKQNTVQNEQVEVEDMDDL